MTFSPFSDSLLQMVLPIFRSKIFKSGWDRLVSFRSLCLRLPIKAYLWGFLECIEHKDSQSIPSSLFLEKKLFRTNFAVTRHKLAFLVTRTPSILTHDLRYLRTWRWTKWIPTNWLKSYSIVRSTSCWWKELPLFFPTKSCHFLSFHHLVSGSCRWLFDECWWFFSLHEPILASYFF